MTDTRSKAQQERERKAQLIETLRHYYPNGATVHTLQTLDGTRIFAIQDGATGDPQYIAEVTHTAAAAYPYRSTKSGAIKRNAQDVYEAVRWLTGHDLRHSRI